MLQQRRELQLGEDRQSGLVPGEQSWLCLLSLLQGIMSPDKLQTVDKIWMSVKQWEIFSVSMSPTSTGHIYTKKKKLVFHRIFKFDWASYIFIWCYSNTNFIWLLWGLNETMKVKYLKHGKCLICVPCKYLSSGTEGRLERGFAANTGQRCMDLGPGPTPSPKFIHWVLTLSAVE